MCANVYLYNTFLSILIYTPPFFVYLVSSFIVSCCDRTHGAQNPS